jgi:hypothetical protein
MVNEQFTWLTPFSQQAQPELTWRNRSHGDAETHGKKAFLCGLR